MGLGLPGLSEHGYVAVTIASNEPPAVATVDAQQGPGPPRAVRTDGSGVWWSGWAGRVGRGRENPQIHASPRNASANSDADTSSVSLLSSGIFGWEVGVWQILPLCRTGRFVMPSQKKRPVVLTEADREELVRLTTTGVHPASMIMRARVLLALDTSAGEVDAKEVIAARLEVSGETLRLVAKRFAETGGDVHATIGAQAARPAAGALAGDRRGRGPADRAGLLGATARATRGGRCGCWRSTSR